MPINEIFKHSGMNGVELAKYFNIPYRTVQNWKAGARKCPEYLIDLMIYKLKKERKWRE